MPFMRKKICYHKVNVKKHSQNSHNSPRQVSFPNENRNSSAEFIILFFFLVLILFCTICIFPNFWTLLFQSCRLLEMFVTHRDVPFWGERHQRLPISIVSEIPPLPLSFVEPPPPPPIDTHFFLPTVRNCKGPTWVKGAPAPLLQAAFHSSVSHCCVPVVLVFPNSCWIWGQNSCFCFHLLLSQSFHRAEIILGREKMVSSLGFQEKKR